MLMASLWDKYDSDTTYDEYLGEDNKLRKQAKVISNILERIGSKKLQEIERNCASTISARGINFRVYSSGKKAQEKNITKIYFDRGIYKYHGRVKAFAETLRKNGMEF